jgi:hypothetical protein
MAVLPGSAETVAVYYHPDPRISAAKIAVVDNGVKRPGEINAPDGFDGLLFSPDGRFLFLGSYTNFNSPQEVLRYAVDDSGIPAAAPAAAFGGGPVAVVDGILLYTSRGTLIDFENMEVVNTLGAGGSVAIDKENWRILAVYFEPTPGGLAGRANAQERPNFGGTLACVNTAGDGFAVKTMLPPRATYAEAVPLADGSILLAGVAENGFAADRNTLQPRFGGGIMHDHVYPFALSAGDAFVMRLSFLNPVPKVNATWPEAMRC